MAETLKNYLRSQLKNVLSIKKIQGEASNRIFYRIQCQDNSKIAMVYPNKNPNELKKISNFTNIYLKHNIPVPKIIDIIDDRIILQEDLGNLMFQRGFRMSDNTDKSKFIKLVADLLFQLSTIPTNHTASILDGTRMKWEMDFFLSHFTKNYIFTNTDSDSFIEFQSILYKIVEDIQPINTFAHRDFHSRNMLLYNNRVYLVDFQDSLIASPYYDLVSFAYDCYLDLGFHRDALIALLKEKGISINEEQLYISALQRNIKALGTFGFQVAVKNHLAYKKYIPRTLRHITTNPLFSRYFKYNHFLINKPLPTP